MSIRAYATAIGKDEKTVRNAINAGMLGDGWDPAVKKVNVAAADEAWGNVHRAAKGKSFTSPPKNFEQLFEKAGTEKKKTKARPSSEDEEEEDWLAQEEIRTGTLLESITVHSNLKTPEAIRRREILALQMDKKKLEEMEGVLVRRDKVEKALFALASELKKSLLAMPQRICADIMAAPNEVEAMNIMTDELTHILDTYGNLKKDTLTA